MPFTAATWNILATVYIRPDWYPNTPSEMLRPDHRHPRLVQRLTKLDADLICLQEVEEEVFVALNQAMTPLGYEGAYTKKGQDKPDGCAAFWRKEAFGPVQVVRLDYRDGDGLHPDSGHVAQILVVEYAGRRVGVANTHIRWDPPDKPYDDKFGIRQVRQLLRERASLACSGWIVCGDFNATPVSDVVAEMRSAGLDFAHVGLAGAYTSNAKRRAKVLDYLFHDAALRAEPVPLPAIRHETPMPGPDYPSDHLPVIARFDWAD